jgi:hypothetical protein
MMNLNHFSGPEFLTTSATAVSEINAFQAAAATLDAISATAGLTAFDYRMIGSTARYDAQSAELARVARI